MSNIHYLHGSPDPISMYLRVGHSGHKQLEALIGAGNKYTNRFVIDAPYVDQQKELIDALKESRSEIILDTQVADLSVVGRFDGACKRLPWATNGRPISNQDLTGLKGKDVTKKIADFAVTHGFDAVLAPTHMLSSAFDNWLGIDVELCEQLRSSLDAGGGAYIAIDYPILVPYQMFLKPDKRAIIKTMLRNVPYENLWIRISKSSKLSPLGTRRYIEASSDFLELKKPIIADCAGGLSALANASFGGCAAISHGVGIKEYFNTSSWNKPRTIQNGGQTKRVYIRELDRYFDEKQFINVMSAHGAKRLLGCNEPECCKHGFPDMIDNRVGHFLFQRHRQIEDLSRAPGLKRAEHFLKHHVEQSLRIAQQAKKLKIKDKSYIQLLINNHERLERFQRVIENMGANYLSESPRSEAPNFRGGAELVHTMEAN